MALHYDYSPQFPPKARDIYGLVKSTAKAPTAKQASLLRREPLEYLA
jgi:hypothetical protein